MRLVFFGDSFTYGQGYPDCKPKVYADVVGHSQFNWCSQTAEALSAVYVNKSYPASSNQQILHALRQFDRQPDDYIVIQWSYADRDMILEHNGLTQITPWFKGKVFERYYKLHNDYDMNYRSDLAIEHASLLLKGTSHLMLANNKYKRTIDNLFAGFEMDHCIDTWDDGHPGPNTNSIWAALVADLIKRGGP